MTLDTRARELADAVARWRSAASPAEGAAALREVARLGDLWIVASGWVLADLSREDGG